MVGLTAEVLQYAVICRASAPGLNSEETQSWAVAGSVIPRKKAAENRKNIVVMRRIGILLIRQEKSDIVSHPFPQKTREWMGHPHSI